MTIKYSWFCILFTLYSLSIGSLAKGRPAPFVSLETVEMKTLSSQVEAVGTLRANESVQITANVTESITGIHFDDGEHVDAGDLLVEMTSAEEHALLEEAQTTAEEAKRQLQRVKQLVKVNNASESLMDERKRDYDAASARLIATQSRLRDRIILSPFSGQLGLRNVSLGTLVKPGDIITTLTDNTQMKVDFDIPTVLLAKVKVGQTVEAKSQVYGEQVFGGQVVSIDNQVDRTTRTIKVRALIPNPEQLLKQGMLMNLELIYNSRNGLVVSEESIVQNGKQHFVFVIEDGEKTTAQKRLVTIGERQRGKVEILEGVQAGERIVHHGAFKLRPGSEVKIKADPLAKIKN